MSYSERLAEFESLEGEASSQCADACCLVIGAFVGVFLERNGLTDKASWPDLSDALSAGVSGAPDLGEPFRLSFDEIMFDADDFAGWYDSFTQDALLGLDDGLAFAISGERSRFDALAATVVNMVLIIEEDYPDRFTTAGLLDRLLAGDIERAGAFAAEVRRDYEANWPDA